MKKLRKLTIDKLSESLTACSSSEMPQFIGGGYYFFFDKDGKLSKSEEFAGDGNFVFANGNSMEVGDTFNVTETPASENQREGLSITGGNLDVFKFLADNTDVEWAASYNPGAEAS